VTVTARADIGDVVDSTSDAVCRSSSPGQQSSSIHTRQPAHQHHHQQSPVSAVSCDAELQLEGVLFVVGDALLDVYADVSHDFLATHHLQHGRAIVASDQHKGKVKSNTDIAVR